MENLVILIICIYQMPGIIIRYYPFRGILNARNKIKLFKSYFLIFIFNICSLYLLKYYIGIDTLTCKISFMLVRLMYFSANCIIINKNIYKQIFIFGMQSNLGLFIETVIVTIHRTLLINIIPLETRVIPGLTYVILSMIIIKVFIIPMINKYIVYFVSDQPYYWEEICMIPVVINTAAFIMECNGNWVKSSGNLPIFFLFNVASYLILKSTTLNLDNMQEKIEIKHNNQILKSQVESIKEYFYEIKEIKREMSIMNHDMRHYIVLLSGLVKEERYSEVEKVLSKLNKYLEDVKIYRYCNNIFIDSILSLYIKKANSVGIEIDTNIIIPEKLNINESDLSVVFSNILENAINASLKQKREERKIRLEVKYLNENIVIKLRNRFDGNVIFDSAGLPISLKEGHGIGTRSIEAFARKYNATISYKHEDRWFSVIIFVKDSNN